MSSRVMVTGGRGFIGTHLVDLLARNQFSVISVDIKDTTAKATDRIVHVVGDIRDRHLMSDLFSTGKFDLICDLASLTEIGLCSSKYQRNFEQTEAMLAYCTKYNVDKYIFYSSQFVFRKPDTLPASENDYFPIDYYGVSKTGPGQPGLPARLVAGQFILRHMYNLSDKVLCARWLETPITNSSAAN